MDGEKLENAAGADRRLARAGGWDIVAQCPSVNHQPTGDGATSLVPLARSLDHPERDLQALDSLLLVVSCRWPGC